MTPSLHRLLLVAALLGGAHSRDRPGNARHCHPTRGDGQFRHRYAQDSDKKLVKLEEVQVTGSRIRRVDVEGPSPVSTYDKDYIRSTGAMNVADFLNLLPQTYSGIGAGRSSTPNDLNPEFGQRTETTTPPFNFVLGASAAPPGQTGVSGVSLRGLGAGSTLVLIDGRRAGISGAGNRSSDTRQGFVDLNTIPLGMIDRIEIITDGSSAIYGADAIGGVVNIILKKDWQGSELATSFKGAEHGGGRERSISLTSGFKQGKLRGTVNLSYYDRSDLKASQRTFSKNQDHRNIIESYDPTTGAPIYGSDLRLNWGYPATVQARTGTLNGFFRPDGVTPTNVALTPEGYVSTPPLSAFTGAGPVPPNTGVFASGQRRANTSDFLDIIPESERIGANLNLNYDLNDRFGLFGGYTFSESKSKFDSQAAVSSASASSGFGNFATIVPAGLAHNPFGQDVLVGMVHYEFGPVWQKTNTTAHRANFGVTGSLGETWKWEAAVSYDRQKTNQITRNFNGALVTAALANGTLNPFIDARAENAPDQSSVYNMMALYPTVDSSSKFVSWDFQADGDLFEFWGGPVQMAWGGNYNSAEVESTAVNYTTAVVPVVSTNAVSATSRSQAAFAEFSVPFIGKPNAVPGAQRLELTIAGRYEDYSSSEGVTVPKYTLIWAPVRSVLLRAGYSEGFRPAAPTERATAQTSVNSTVTDPRRTPASTPNVAVTSGSPTVSQPETSDTVTYSFIFEPPFAKGLNLQVNYYETNQEDVLQQLSANNIVLNESIFGSRITRATATAQDIALGQPGALTSVDRTFINFGKVVNRSADYTADYSLPWQELGRWRISLTATQTLESTRQLAPGQPPIIQEDDTYSPPEWKYNATVMWNQGPWNAALFYYYLDGFATNSAGNSLATHPVSSVDKLDLRAGYEFSKGVWRGYGKNLRVMVGIGNVFDQEPPFSDTVYGYNGGLHSQWALGRSYELSFVLPF
jgi:iron complex outermembrane receptor protein